MVNKERVILKFYYNCLESGKHVRLMKMIITIIPTEFAILKTQIPI